MNPAPTSFIFFGSGTQEHERVWNITDEERHQEHVKNGTYTPPTQDRLDILHAGIESAKKNPPVDLGSFAQYADDDETRRRNDSSFSDYVGAALIGNAVADALTSTPDTFSGGGGDFGGGGASGSWDSGSDTSSSSSSCDSSSSYDSGGGSDSGSFGGSD